MNGYWTKSFEALGARDETQGVEALWYPFAKASSFSADVILDQ